ncbi:TonB-dependent receptor plug domain-containing protein [Flavilitoribacter nigricans]|uniref:TonB-dependent receptor plug domain-containing protein n=1 Tax=Flavilitoribacter nigricans (strain ATCC 23147 / DSM 23189 / NBRC 102662 / NCIMB 1420 / SS-2) TaxID=1122177 RepID=A0A2D0MYE6_FLAN2|nr:TonB-dependent receptor plug domain-containing protein [Flavilitoribacter nigricans]PHN01301.1 hypothetical protein CRP01_37710 [Flavilitoribacter nigricans DSM 23189 = NBRC 102662]
MGRLIHFCKTFIFLFIFAVLLGNCSAGSKQVAYRADDQEIDTGYDTRSSDEFGGSAATVKNPGNHLDLTAHLRKVVGVNVTGSGSTAKISIRANQSTTFQLGTAPLFVVNGASLGHNYANVYQLVNVDNIKSITVLKDNSSTSIYGREGVNGVILIKLK